MDKYEVIKFKDNEFEMDVNVSPFENTVWLTQKQMIELFNVSKSTISEHINNIFKEGELISFSVVRNFRTTASDGKKYNVKFYNLDMIISVGYRVKSKRGVLFRQWANQVLKQYLLNGYVINENRVVVSNENFLKLSNEVASINTRLIKLEDKVFDDHYGELSIRYNDKVHDRYIIIDQNKIYHLGASIKDLGKKIFSINELHQDNIEVLMAKV